MNDKLIALAETKDMAALNEGEAKAAMENFAEWNRRHLVRMSAGGIAWVLGAIAFILF